MNNEGIVIAGGGLAAARLVAALVSGQDAETQESLTRLLRGQPPVTRRDVLTDPATPPAEAFA